MRRGGSSLCERAMKRFARRSVQRRAALASATGLAAALLAVGVYAGQLDRQAFRVNHRHARLDGHVVATGRDRVAVRRRAGLEPPLIGLEYPGGHALLDAVDGPWYRIARVWGRRPVRGMPCRFDSFVYPGDPELAHGLPFEEVRYATELGPCPAWVVPGGNGDLWAVAVHGKGASPREVLRMLPAFHRAGVTVFAIAYRNDVDAPPSSDRRYTFGRQEWRDLEAAVRFAVERGARRIALFGFSMGGAVCASFLRSSPLREHVVGLGLDAPMLDLRAAVRHRARHHPLPTPVHEALLPAAGLLLRIPWRELRYVDETGQWPGPVFLAHGTADPLVPVATSDEAAARLGDRVRYVRVEGAGHVRSWNADPERYEATLTAWLEELRART